MGNFQGFQHAYSIPLNDAKAAPDSTPVLRAASHPDALVESFSDGTCTTSWHLFQGGKEVQSGTRHCLGQRDRNPKDGSIARRFSWMTYADVEGLALTLGTALLDSGCVEPIEYDDEIYSPARRLRLLGIFCKNRVEWFICEQAANAYDLTLVPLYDTLGKTALEFILARTRMTTVACSLECLPQLLEGIEATLFVSNLLMFLHPHETVPQALLHRCTAAGVTQILYYRDIVNLKPSRNTKPICPGGPDHVNTICFTSGTTGTPKGVFLTHRNVVSCVAAIIRGPVAEDFNLRYSDVTISYLPLAHVLERAVCNAVLALGAAIGVYSEDKDLLMEDIQLLNPTIFVSVPRLYNRLNDAIVTGVSQKSAVARLLFGLGRNSKLNHLRNNATTSNLMWDQLVFKNTKHLMGSRLRYMISGGAPLDALIQEHMKILFCAPLMEGYGLTETLGPAFLANPRDPVSGHIGGPIPCVEYRLVSVPEMCYNVDDRPPRGELLIRGYSVTPGYFRDAEETQSVLDSDGWFHTGDIALILPNGSVKIIDRKKNIFKLSQGEYVAPEKIEAVYAHSPLVSQIFVFGYSDRNNLVAVVVPDQAALELYAKKHGKCKGSFDDLCVNPDIKTAILNDMNCVAEKAGLKGFERVKDIYIEKTPFAVDSELLTPTLKIRRHQAKKVYQSIIDAMYAKSC